MKRASLLSFLGIILPLALLLMAPLATHAASKATFFGPIVPAECHCDNQPIVGGSGTANTAPDFGCALQVIQNAINFGITLSTIIFTLYLVLTGISFMTSHGSSEARSAAKTRFMNVFIGLAVLLCAWLVVDYVMKVVYNDKGFFGPWNAILASDTTDASRCIIAHQPTSITAGSLVTGLVGTATTQTPGLTSSSTSATGGALNAKVCAAASSYRGASTAAGPEGGNKACAWAVNNVLKNAGIQPVGGDAVSGMESALKSGRGTLISQAQASCGDIVIEAGDGHVGICQNDGCTSVISNSSSKATFTWISSVDFKPSYNSGNGRIYRLNS